MPADQPEVSSPSARERPLRVLLMAGSMEGGGSERQTLLLLRHLDRRSFRPLLFLRHRTGPLLREIPEDVKVMACDDGDAEAISRRAAGWNWPGRELRRQTQHLIECLVSEQVDVIYDRTFHMTMIAGPASKHTGVPHVSTIVSLPQLAFPLLETKFRWVKKQRLVRAYRSAASVIAVSEAVSAAAASFYGLSPQSITTIHNPVDRERLLTEAKKSIDWTPAPDVANLVCIGRMSEEKGHSDLLRALAPLRDRRWCLWLVGDGPLHGDLQKLTVELGLSRRLGFLGHVDRAAAVLARCQLCILPSRFEGMPNVVLEAMALGVPVIATDAGGTPELLRRGALGSLVPPAHPAALQEAIARFFDAPQSFAERAEAAKKIVAGEHSVATVVRRIEAVLREAVDNTRRH